MGTDIGPINSTIGKKFQVNSYALIYKIKTRLSVQQYIYFSCLGLQGMLTISTDTSLTVSKKYYLLLARMMAVYFKESNDKHIYWVNIHY